MVNKISQVAFKSEKVEIGNCYGSVWIFQKQVFQNIFHLFIVICTNDRKYIEHVTDIFDLKNY